MITRNTPIQRNEADDAQQLAARMLGLCGGKRKTLIEVALLIAYAAVADGVQAYPTATRNRRASLFVEQGTAALCDVIKRVGDLPDELLAVRSPDTTCQE